MTHLDAHWLTDALVWLVIGAALGGLVRPILQRSRSRGRR